MKTKHYFQDPIELIKMGAEMASDNIKEFMSNGGVGASQSANVQIPGFEISRKDEVNFGSIRRRRATAQEPPRQERPQIMPTYVSNDGVTNQRQRRSSAILSTQSPPVSLPMPETHHHIGDHRQRRSVKDSSTQHLNVPIQPFLPLHSDVTDEADVHREKRSPCNTGQQTDANADDDEAIARAKRGKSKKTNERKSKTEKKAKKSDSESRKKRQAPVEAFTEIAEEARKMFNQTVTAMLNSTQAMG